MLPPQPGLRSSASNQDSTIARGRRLGQNIGARPGAADNNRRRTMKLPIGMVLATALAVPAAQAADPITIGVVDEMTGPNAEAGVLVLHGTRLAVDEINAAGGIMGRPIELKVEDNASTNPGTVLAYSKLV